MIRQNPIEDFSYVAEEERAHAALVKVGVAIADSQNAIETVVAQRYRGY